jgi:cAMP-dependent protein kinase regulator
LGRRHLFDGIEGPQKDELYALMFEKKVESGTNVITQGEEGDNFYVIDDGTCDVIVNGNNVASLKNGDSFGELALMYFAPRAATIAATVPTTLWAMDRVTFRSMLFEKASSKRTQYKEFLNKVPLLDPMESYEKEKIADVLEPANFEDGEKAITEGEEGDAFYIVVEGNAVATKLIGEEEKEVKTYAPGDFFGELALMSDQPRAASVVAKGELKCAKLGRQAFTRLVGACSDILARNQDLYEEINQQMGGASAVADKKDELQAENESLKAEVSKLAEENERLKARVAELEA